MDLIVSGVALGSLYGLLALGFVVIYKATRVLNFAQGTLMMVSAYVCYTLIVNAGVPTLLAVLLTILSLSVVGVGIHFMFMRPLVGKPLFTVGIATLGLSVILTALVRLVWGSQDRDMPAIVPAQTVHVLGTALSTSELWVIAVAVLCVGLFAAFFRFSKLGLMMRAIADDSGAAVMMGVSPDVVFATSWALASAMAAVAGIFLANLTVVNTGLADLGLRTFAALVVGGLESIPGVLVGGLIIGLAETEGAAHFGSDTRDMIPFAVLLAIILIRPVGLFGRRPVARV